MLKKEAAKLIENFKGEHYAFGDGALDSVGRFASEFGKTALVIGNLKFLKPVVDGVMASLEKHGVSCAGGKIVPDAGPNAPREDVYRIESYILHFKPDCIVVIGGGSSIDAAKAANVLACVGKYSPEIDTYFGTGQVSAALAKTGQKLIPLIAVQTAASSGAHLTKYSNITDPVAGQKKLIVDEAIVPARAVFDYSVTQSAPLGLTIDGAIDGLAHCLEVFYGAGPDKFEMIKDIALRGIELVLIYAKSVVADPRNLEGREALGLATDLGAYSIMVGGTNGAHLTSFSLVDVTSHGRACGIMNPYYTVFFAPAIEEKLRLVGEIYQRNGFINADLAKLNGKQLGTAVAQGMLEFNKSIGLPTSLSDLPDFTPSHVKRALKAAKDPQLEMKLKNMPVPMAASQVDEYMGPILEAASAGKFDLIKNIS